MNTKTEYEFTLVLGGVDDKTEGLEDQLFEAGCDDALINFRNATAYIDFIRKADSISDAVIEAIQQVESTALSISVISVLPSSLVNEVDIAKRADKSRQIVSLWVKRQRRADAQPFPHPVAKLQDASPLWRWCEVSAWLFGQHLIDDETVVETAEFIEHLNAVLAERDPAIKKYRHNILKKLRS